VSNLVGFSNLLGQSKFQGLAFFSDLNQEGVDTMLVRVAH